MNTAKKISKIVLGLTIVITIAAGIFIYLTTKYPQLFGTKIVETPTPSPKATFIPNLILNARVEESTILITLSPEEDSTDLLALSLRATLRGERGIPIVKEIIPNQDLIKSGWYFPFEKTSRDQDGNVVIEISAFHTGGSFYPVSKEITLASLVFSETPNTGALTFTIDPSVTKFRSPNNMAEIGILTNSKEGNP